MSSLPVTDAVTRVAPGGVHADLRAATELVERRTANSKTFQLDDKKRFLVVFCSYDIHKLDEKGQWVELPPEEPATDDALRALVDYTSAEDGWISGTSTVYATARSTSTAGLTSDLEDPVGQTLSGSNYIVYRGYLRFDTSALPDDCVVDTADLYLMASEDDSTTNFIIAVVNEGWTSPLLDTREANYDQGLAVGAAAWYSVAGGWTPDTWYDGSVSTAIVSKTASTYIILASGRDRSATKPTGDEYVLYYTRDADAGKRPYLTVTYHEGEIIHETAVGNADAAGYDSTLKLGVAPVTAAGNADAGGYGAVARAYVLPIMRVHTSSHAAGVAPLLYVYDRDGQRVGDCLNILREVKGMTYSSTLPGGYMQCNFELPIAIRKWLSAREAFEVEVRCGKQEAWAGRLTDPTWRSGGGGSRLFQALGMWAAMKQRRLDSLTAETGETATGLLQRAYRLLPFLSPDYSKWDETGFDVGGKSWIRKDLQTITTDVVKLGDDQTPPRVWDLCVWGRGMVPTTGGVSVSVQAGADDAYSNTSEGDQSAVSTVLRTGWLTTSFYAGMIFSPGLERYSKITTAVLTLYSAGDLGANEPAKLRIKAELSGVPADYSGGSWPHERTLTTAYVDWSQTWPAAGNTVTSPDISEVIQEVINLPTWSPSSRINIVVYGLPDTPNDTRKMFDSYEAAGSNQPKLDITTGALTGMIWPFRTSFLPRRVLDMDSVDYWIRADQVLSGFNVMRSLAALENYVVVKYSTEPVLYTAAIEDADSQTLYDRRDNDPDELNAGDDATLAMAQNLAATYIAEHAVPRWLAESITVSQVYNRGGWPANPALVKAGDIIALGDYPGFVRGGEYRIFRIVKAQYNVEGRKLNISPEKLQDSLAVQLLRAKEG
jgi:hypothetical protein